MNAKSSNKDFRRLPDTTAGREDYLAAIDRLLKTTTAELATLRRRQKAKSGQPRGDAATTAWAVERLELMKSHLTAYLRASRMKDDNG